MKLESLTHPDDDPQLIREACFYVGWQLRSRDSWQYRNIFTNEEGEVTIKALIEAVKAKREQLKPNPKVVPINQYTHTRTRNRR